ncbi:XAC0095 family protein [Pseudoxanthomonas indica]|uniref:XAC0095-like domain-containing protein n=1 Tax=Pseudoxanthomonas indica TaxID=428993 RepID=A0A1T5IYF6_9GAMM|nr:hypothetical protein [Pseudoxanthomonas indica]GGD55072.1 hypothetical protein GCM10007235_29220 [Pseudoxanthomonas indica]SKC44225.1 hypothetical protein SAMN06296058_0343 [Pseudoxanthomonas indica]
MSSQSRNSTAAYALSPAGYQALVRLIAQLNFYAALAQVEFSDARDIEISRATISACFAELADQAGRVLAEMRLVEH